MPLRDFIVSPGFAGAAAVVAALIVLCAVLYAARRAGKRLDRELEQRDRHHQETRDAEQRALASRQCWETLKWLVKTAGVEPAASEGATLGLGPELAMATLRGLLRDAERLEDETLADAVTVHQSQFALVLAQQGGPLSELAAGAPPAIARKSSQPQAPPKEEQAKATGDKPGGQPAPDEIPTSTTELARRTASQTMTTTMRHITDLGVDEWAALTRRAAVEAVEAAQRRGRTPPAELAAVAAMSERQLVERRARNGPARQAAFAGHATRRGRSPASLGRRSGARGAPGQAGRRVGSGGGPG